MPTDTGLEPFPTHHSPTTEIHCTYLARRNCALRTSHPALVSCELLFPRHRQRKEREITLLCRHHIIFRTLAQFSGIPSPTFAPPSLVEHGFQTIDVSHGNRFEDTSLPPLCNFNAQLCVRIADQQSLGTNIHPYSPYTPSKVYAEFTIATNRLLLLHIIKAGPRKINIGEHQDSTTIERLYESRIPPPRSSAIQSPPWIKQGMRSWQRI